MIRNKLLIAYRNLNKNKLFSILNLIGLSVGFSSFLLIILFILFEKSFEDFIPENEYIYRVALKQFNNNELALHTTENYPAVGPAMQKEIPGVVSFARLYNLGYKNNVIITYDPPGKDPIKFRHRNFLYADSSFLTLMGYPITNGNGQSALAKPFSAVITKKYANLYFGDENPIGKVLHMQDDDNNNELCTITAVIEDAPANSHLQFDVLFSYSTLYSRYEGARARYDQNWTRNDMYTYIKLEEKINPNEVVKAFQSLIKTHSPDLEAQGRRDEVELQPITSIHLYSNIAEEQQANGNHIIISSMLIISIFIVVLACINYVNLSTASLMDRASEVGIKKVLGASKFSLVNQFLIEVGLLNFVAFMIAMLMVVLMLPLLSELASTKFSLRQIMDSDFLIIAGCLLIGNILIAGLYPALVLSNYGIIDTLKGKIRNKKFGMVLRNGLIIFQFVVAISLISSTFLIKDQLRYLLSQDLGVDTNQVLVIERPGIAPKDPLEKKNATKTFKRSLQNLSGVSNVTASLTIPGKKREYKSPFKKYGDLDDNAVILRWNSMDYDYIDTYGMNLLAGRGFSETYMSDQDTSAIVTESVVKLFGFRSPEEIIGQTITIPNSNFAKIVVGVVNDYHQESLKKNVDPIIFVCSFSLDEYYSVKLSDTNYKETINEIEDRWNIIFPGNPFEYFFLDEFFNKQYGNEQRFSKMTTLFSIIIIILTSLGLVGMSAYTVRQRTKEMAIRKSMGASSSSVFMLTCASYFTLILWSVIIALPATWLIMNRWYETFAFRTSFNFIYLIAGLFLTCLITLLAIAHQAIKLATSNPVNALKAE